MEGWPGTSSAAGIRSIQAAGHAQRFLSAFGIINSHFHVVRHLFRLLTLNLTIPLSLEHDNWNPLSFYHKIPLVHIRSFEAVGVLLLFLFVILNFEATKRRTFIRVRIVTTGE